MRKLAEQKQKRSELKLAVKTSAYERRGQVAISIGILQVVAEPSE